MKIGRYKKVATRKISGRVELTLMDQRGIAAAEAFAQSLRTAYAVNPIAAMSASARVFEPISVMAGPMKKLRFQVQE